MHHDVASVRVQIVGNCRLLARTNYRLVLVETAVSIQITPIVITGIFFEH